MNKSFDEVFDVDHPVFCWIFRASRCWQSVADLLPTIRTHLLGNESSFSDIWKLYSAAKDDNYSFLSALIQVPFENIGMLYGSIMRTGTLKKHAQWKQLQAMRKPNKLDKAGSGQSSTVFGRGQLLFLVRRVNTRAALHRSCQTRL